MKRLYVAIFSNKYNVKRYFRTTHNFEIYISIMENRKNLYFAYNIFVNKLRQYTRHASDKTIFRQ